MLSSLKLNENTKRAIERSTGIPFCEMELMDAMSIDKRIEQNKNIKLSYPTEVDSRAPGRGSVYMTLNRVIRYTPESLDKALYSIK